MSTTNSSTPNPQENNQNVAEPTGLYDNFFDLYNDFIQHCIDFGIRSHFIKHFNRFLRDINFDFNYFNRHQSRMDERYTPEELAQFRPEIPQPTSRGVYLEHRNYQSFQQNCLIALINRYGEVHIRKERKRSTISVPFFNLLSFKPKYGERINIHDQVKKLCEDLLQEDLKNEVPGNTAERRYKTNRISEVIHALIRIAKSKGYLITTRLTRPQKGIRQTETMIGIKVGENELGERAIKAYGRTISDILRTVLANEDEVVFQQGELYSTVFGVIA